MTTRYVTSTNINEVYKTCLRRRTDYASTAVTYPGFMATPHTFDQRRLERESGFVLCALKKLPASLRRSNGCTGLPWFTARRLEKHAIDIDLDVTDRLLSMAAALDFITVVHPEDAVCDVAYIIIEDIRLKRKYRLKNDERRAKWD